MVGKVSCWCRKKRPMLRKRAMLRKGVAFVISKLLLHWNGKVVSHARRANAGR